MLLIVFISEAEDIHEAWLVGHPMAHHAVHLQKSETWIKDSINISNFISLHCEIKECIFNSMRTHNAAIGHLDGVKK